MLFITKAKPTVKLGGIVHTRPPLFLISLTSVGDPYNWPQFVNLPKKLIELTKSCYAHGYSLLQGKDTD